MQKASNSGVKLSKISFRRFATADIENRTRYETSYAGCIAECKVRVIPVAAVSQ